MRKYYSQHGEDFLLWSIFNRKNKPGFFVEVGGLDGIRLSNTYSFDLEGWSGICVEPHPDYYPLLKKNRPNSICIEAAAGNHDGFIEFYAEPRGEYSTMVQDHVEDERYLRKMAGYEKITVPILRLDKILKDVQAPVSIDVISIDVEGAEIAVLEGFDISYYKPRVLVIEANDADTDKLVDKHMKANGYLKAGRLGRTNNFYCREYFDAIKLAHTPLKCTLSVAPQPLSARVGEDDTWGTKQMNQPSLAVEKWKRFFIRVSKRFSNIFKFNR